MNKENKEEIIKEFRRKFQKDKILFRNSNGDIKQDDYLLEDIEDFWLSKLKSQKEEIIKMIEIKDAYKIPFSKAEIDYELLPENRAKKEIVNEYYKKGRDDEFFDLLFKIKQL